jgi:cytochrome c553
MTDIRRAFLLSVLALAAGAVLAQSKGNPARGEALAKTCAACHGSNERAPLPLTPSLAGQPEDYMVLQLFLLREGLREAPPMEGLLKNVTDPDFFDLAAYYVRQPPARTGANADAQLRARGAALSRQMGCGSCHLGNYRGQRTVPLLANQREDYLAASLRAYRDNKRVGTDTNMNGLMLRVSDADIQALAHYLAHQ